jgi:hypothetical protein
MTSRWFCQATIPLLYKHVNLINNRAARGFVFQPNVYSFALPVRAAMEIKQAVSKSLRVTVMILH